MSIKQFNVTTAYSNGVIGEEVFMKTPNFLAEALENIIQTEQNSSKIGIRAKRMQKDLESGDKVCLLKKSLCSLRQAGRSWHVKLGGVLKRFGTTSSNADPCVYYLGQEEEILIIAIYVDDILIASQNLEKIAKFKEEILKEFDIRDPGEPKYCLGIEFSRDGNTIAMNQKGYIKELLDRFGMAECKPVTTPFDINVTLMKPEEDSTTEEKKLPYRELVSALMYLAVATRPDIAHAVSALNQFNNAFGKIHWTAAKRVLRYLKGTADLGLLLSPLKNSLKVYFDADWASCLVDRRSYTGYTFRLSNGTISWDSSKQRTVALSSTEAEYMALAEATKEAIHPRGFLSELGFRTLADVKLFNDNMGAKRLAENPTFHARS